MSKTIAVMLLLAASPALADQSTTAPALRSSARFGALRPSQDPYKKLFVPPQILPAPRKRAQPAIDSSAPAPKVVCGMTVIPASPNIDPKMVLPRKSDGVDYAIRAIDPPICNRAR
jgi:hypothetical protein